MNSIASDRMRKQELHVEHERRIDAPIEDVFEALLDQLGPRAVRPDGTSLSMNSRCFRVGAGGETRGTGTAIAGATSRRSSAPLCSR